MELRGHPTIIERTGLKNQDEHAILRILQAVSFCYQKRNKKKNNMEYELFSKRQQRMQGETPDTYPSEAIPRELRVQIFYIWGKVWGTVYENLDGESDGSRLGMEAFRSIENTLCEEYGVFNLEEPNPYREFTPSYLAVKDFFINTEDTDKVIDVIEVSFRYIDQEIRDKFYVPDDGLDGIFGPRHRDIPPDSISPDEAIDLLNLRFSEHGVGYQYESGQIEKVDSPESHSEVVKPAEELPSNTQQPTNQDTMNNANKKIFIGHGRSHIWRALKDFIVEKLKLPYEEFERIPTAGMSISNRLKEMLEGSCMAFIIMTGEDEHADNLLHARENVIHEVGLFQGRLGFKKAIILLEDGCERFSNIEGLIYISFPKGDITAAFEKIRDVLEFHNIKEKSV